MSKKRVIALILVLAFGIVFILGGFLINSFIQNLVFNNIDYALLEMRDRAGPLAEPIVNSTISVNGINMIVTISSLGALFNDSSTDSGLAWYINQTYGTGDLNYTLLAQDRIAYGNNTGDPDSPYYLPGILADLNQGTGLMDYLDLYEMAVINLAEKNQMIDNYNCTWEHLGYVKDYYYNYCIVEIPTLIEMGIVSVFKPELQGLNSTLEIAEFYFLQQWCNGSLFPNGFPLPLQAGIFYGFEVGYQSQTVPIIPTNMTRNSMYQLWNTSNPYSLVTDEGLNHWWNIGPKNSTHYNATRDVNYLEDDVVDMIVAWLSRFLSNIMPYLAQEAYSLPTDTTTLGNAIQRGGVAIGLPMICLAATIIVRNRIIKRKDKSLHKQDK
ncbi:MAG: hypothetical protein HWN66_12770 [Candidatus Helarchaeota archaeon]|nr:hypothetical protein [Candidatus Helarchaeota archaeon]